MYQLLEHTVHSEVEKITHCGNTDLLLGIYSSMRAPYIVQEAQKHLTARFISLFTAWFLFILFCVCLCTTFSKKKMH